MGQTQSDIALSLFGTKMVAHSLASVMGLATGDTYKAHHIEEGSFELSLNGEEFAGGSFYIDKDGTLVCASTTPQVRIGNPDKDSSDHFRTQLIKFAKGELK